MTDIPPSTDPYDRYETVVQALYAWAGSVSWSQEFEAAPPEECTPADLAAALLEAVQPNVWAGPYKSMPSNWQWRTKERPAQGFGELALERKIISVALEAGRTDWTYQMPTMSGLTGPTAHKKRAIDLVHRIAPSHYELIELKLGSNDPAHAAFEILFYGLAYLRARQYRAGPFDDEHAVLSASRIDLVVLAPRSWYRHKMRDAAYTIPYLLARLTRVLNETLRLIRSQLALPGLDDLTFGFKVFEDEEKILADVRAGRSGKEYARGGE